MSHFYTLRKRHNNIGFLTCSGGIEMYYWTKMGLRRGQLAIVHNCYNCKYSFKNAPS